MAKAILFKAVMITLSVMGSICFLDKYLQWAASLWVLGSVLFLVFFPRVEGEPRSRLNRFISDIVPVLFFILISGLVLLARKGYDRDSVIVFFATLFAYAVVIAKLLWRRRREEKG